MPSLWKKKINGKGRGGSSRISRLVADLQSPKRGGSLVVETGFPTSLIDLFVKNRDRLREKKIKKKRFEIPPHAPEMLHSSSSSGLKIIDVVNHYDKDQEEEDNVLLRQENKEHDHDDDDVVFCDYVEETRKLDNGCDKSLDFDDGSRSNSITVLIAGLKVFVVVALALTTKKLALGITMSAFALLLLECATKRLACLQGAIIGFNSVIRRLVSVFMCLISKKQVIREEEEEEVVCVFKETELVCGRESTSSIEEIIECVESESAPDVAKVVEDIATELDKRLEHRRSFVENKHGDDVGHKSRHSWHGKSIKAKFVNKLVPKKLRSSKECKDKPRFMFSGQVVCETSLKTEDHEICEKSNQGSFRSQSKVLDNEMAGSEDVIVCPEPQIESKSLIEESPMATNSKGYSKSGMAILLLIILAGLGFGWGRLLAMVVTVVGYSTVAFVEKIRRDQTSKCERK
ncbi:hypothetical protein ACFE04_014532 [Oxalis oulophora]